MLELTVNGEKRVLEEAISVTGLLEQLGLNAKKVAVERNREIVPKSQYAETQLKSGDAIEIVAFVGGG